MWRAGLWSITVLPCGKLSLKGHYIDILAAFLAGSEHHDTVDESIQGVILAHAHIATRMVCRAALTLDDVTGYAAAAAGDLDAEAFAF